MTFLDELASGVPVAGADALTSALSLSTTLYVGAVFGLPTLFAALVEAPLLAWSDRHRAARARFIVIGLVGQAVAIAIVACAPSVWLLAFGVALYAPCSGLSCALAEVVVVEGSADDPERALARWTFAGALGDLTTPLVLLACALLDMPFSVASSAIAGVVLVGALLVSRVALDAHAGSADEGHDDDDDVALWVAFRRAFAHGPLVAWLFATALVSTLLDETLAAFTVLHASDPERSGSGEILLVAFALGELAASSSLARLVDRFAPRRVLVVAALVTSGALLALLFVDDVGRAMALACVVGVAATPLYPLAKAQAFRSLPGEGGLVAAVERLFAPLDVVLPLALALLADRHGPDAAIGAIALAPLVVVVAVWLAPPRVSEESFTRTER